MTLGHRDAVEQQTSAALGRADSIAAELVILADDALHRGVTRDAGRLSRTCLRDLLVMTHPVTTGCLIAAVDPEAGGLVNAAVLGTALAHSHLHHCDLHIVCRLPTDDSATRSVIADLLAPICGLDSSRIHLARGNWSASLCAIVRDTHAGMVVLGALTERIGDLGHIVGRLVPSSSIMVVRSHAADHSMSTPLLRRRVLRRQCR